MARLEGLGGFAQIVPPSISDTGMYAPPVRPRRRRVNLEPLQDPNPDAHTYHANRVLARKRLYLTCLVQSMGIFSPAMHAAGVAYSTLKRWRKEDPIFREKEAEIGLRQVGHVESKLMEKINSGETKAIVFFLSTKGRDAGYETRYALTTPEPLRTENVTSLRADLPAASLLSIFAQCAQQNPQLLADVAAGAEPQIAINDPSRVAYGQTAPPPGEDDDNPALGLMPADEEF